MEIAELVPFVAGFEGSNVRIGDDSVASYGIEHGQVSGVRVMPSGDQTVDDAHVVLGCDHEICPSAVCVCYAVGCR